MWKRNSDVVILMLEWEDRVGHDIAGFLEIPVSRRERASAQAPTERERDPANDNSNHGYNSFMLARICGDSLDGR